MRYAIFLLALYDCSAQSITLGVVGGVRATDDINFVATSESERYIVGPMIGLGLPLGFGIEFDALYSREGFAVSNSSELASANVQSHSNVWQLPILAKYSLPLPAVKPFAEIGFAPRFMNGSILSSGSYLASSTGQTQSFNTNQSTNWATSRGLVVGGGVRFKAGRVEVSPEVRYTHWNNYAISYVFADGPGVFSSQNQVDVLIGIGWKATGR